MPFRGEHLRVRLDGGWRDGLPMVRSVVGMRRTPNVHQLDEQPAACRVHAIRHELPSFDVLLGVDAGE